MPVQRGYRDACGIAHALDLVGERWALLVVRELLLGPKRFVDLRRALPAASPNALSARLRELADVGVLRRRRMTPPAASWVYELTDWGRELEPILTALGRWGVRSSLLDPTGHLSAVSVMIAIRTYLRPAAATGTIEIRLDEGGDEERFLVSLTADGAEIRLAPNGRPDTVVRTVPGALIDALGDAERLEAAIGDGAIRIEGDVALARQLIESVALPEPAPEAARR